MTSAALLILLSVAASARPKDADRFVREDWILSYEPTHPDYWGTYWSVNNGYLTYRVLQRAKHAAETRHADNWRFGTETGGAKGMLLRFFAGTALDFGLWMGDHNIHHVTGHDAAAREFDRDFGRGGEVPRRFKQVLPNYLGGRALGTQERQPSGRGADANARAMTLPMESEMVHSYEEGKEILGGTVNATAVTRFMFHRGRFLMDIQEVGTLDQAFIDGNAPGASSSRRVDGPGLSTDFTWYLHYVNRFRYGTARVDSYKLKMGDVKTAIWAMWADPLWWSALYAWGTDYVAGARNTTSLPMLRLGERWSYLPALRVFFSPFGVDWFQDNYFRRGGALVNAYWTIGDNRYEKRYGGGVDVAGLPLPGGGRLGAYAQFHAQPALSRLTDQRPLSADEAGRLHLAYNVGGSIKQPFWSFGSGPDASRMFVYARAGTKNLSWFPGEYLSGGMYAQTGLGLYF